MFWLAHPLPTTHFTLQSGSVPADLHCPPPPPPCPLQSGGVRKDLLLTAQCIVAVYKLDSHARCPPPPAVRQCPEGSTLPCACSVQ